MANKSDEDDKFNAEWIIPLRSQAGFKTRDDFQRAVEKHLKRELDSRYFAGLERIDKGNEYRDQSKAPYDAIVQALNEKLSENEQITAEQLKERHRLEIIRRENWDRLQDAEIYPTGIAQAINACPLLLKQVLLKKCRASNTGEAADYVVERIKSGRTVQVTNLFTTQFQKILSSQPTTQNKAAIWALVQAIVQACFVQDVYADDGEKRGKNIEFTHAWVIRICALLQDGLDINGVLPTKDDEGDFYKLDDAQVHAFIPDGKAYEKDPNVHAWLLMKALVAIYDPSRKEPPHPSVNLSEFQQYCRSLDASLAPNRTGSGLFFSLIAESSESKEVLKVLGDYLPNLLSFVQQVPKGTVEGFLLDDIEIFNRWIAHWLIMTGQVASMDVPLPQEPKQSTQEGTGMHQDKPSQAASTQITINNKDGSVNVQIGEHNVNISSSNNEKMDAVWQVLQALRSALRTEPQAKEMLKPYVICKAKSKINEQFLQKSVKTILILLVRV